MNEIIIGILIGSGINILFLIGLSYYINRKVVKFLESIISPLKSPFDPMANMGTVTKTNVVMDSNINEDFFTELSNTQRETDERKKPDKNDKNYIG